MLRRILTLCLTLCLLASAAWADAPSPAQVAGVRAAAEAGDAEAQRVLGQMYTSGHGVPQDDAQAAIWYRKAAEQGDAEAQFMYGNMRAVGIGVPENGAEGIDWLMKAAKQGHEGAVEVLEQIAGSRIQTNNQSAQRDLRNLVAMEAAFHLLHQAYGSTQQGVLPGAKEGSGLLYGPLPKATENDKGAMISGESKKGKQAGQGIEVSEGVNLWVMAGPGGFIAVAKHKQGNRSFLATNQSRDLFYCESEALIGEPDAIFAVYENYAEIAGKPCGGNPPLSTWQKVDAAAPQPKRENMKPFINSIGMELVPIPAGEFMMGMSEEQCRSVSAQLGDDGEDCEAHRIHRVEITRPFYLGKREVTQGEWMAVMGKLPLMLGIPEERDKAVGGVSWEDAREFIRRLNEREGHQGYRLPTEAEWEYAARAGNGSPIPAPDAMSSLQNPLKFAARLEEMKKNKKTVPPNSWGLHDMDGGLMEWVGDWYGKHYYAQSPAKDPTGPDRGECDEEFHFGEESQCRVLRDGAGGLLGFMVSMDDPEARDVIRLSFPAMRATNLPNAKFESEVEAGAAILMGGLVFACVLTGECDADDAPPELVSRFFTAAAGFRVALDADDAKAAERAGQAAAAKTPAVP